MPGDEVGEDTGGTPGHAQVTVDEDLATVGDGRVDELDDVGEVLADVGLADVEQSETHVLDTNRSVVLRTGVYCHP